MKSSERIDTIPPKSYKPWRFWAALVTTTITAFFFAFKVGIFSIDRTQEIPGTMSGALALSLMWLLRTGFRQELSKGGLALISCFGVAILTALGYTGFSEGQEAAYSPEARSVFKDVSSHGMKIGGFKSRISTQIQAIKGIDEIPILEDNVNAWQSEVGKTEELIQRSYLMNSPAFISGVLDLYEKGLSFDRSEIDNLQEQIVLVKSVLHQSASKRLNAYRTQLSALIKKHQQIESERKSFDFPSQLKQVALKSGFDAAEGDKLAALAAQAAE